MKNNKNSSSKNIENKKDVISYETLNINQSLEVLQTDPNKGLSEEEAQKRLELYGENKLQEKKKKSWIRIFFEQMNNPMIFVLFAAIAVIIGTSIYEVISNINAGLPVSFLETGDWPDVIIILAVILLNSIIASFNGTLI